MEMRIKKRPSLNKLNKDSSQKQKPMNMTISSSMFSHRQLKQAKLPPLRQTMRKSSIRMQKKRIDKQKHREETEATVVGSQMLQSYYQTIDKGWIKPSQYLKDIKQLNLIGDEQIDVQNYEIKLNEKMEKNMGKLELLFGLMDRWISILRKILQYTSTKKNNTPYLMEEVRFWKALSKKFDQLEYEFNNQKTQQLLLLVKNALKVKPEYKNNFEQFMRLRESVIEKTPLLRKLYLNLEQSVSGNLQRFVQSSDILTSAEYLKRTLLNYQQIVENNEIAQDRMQIVYEKMNDSMTQKLTVAPLYPRQLANISSLKQKYTIIDRALSFYSNFISILESKLEARNTEKYRQTLESAEHTRNVLVSLLQILGYFQFLYKKKEVLQFSKLFSQQFDFNIFDYNYKEEWDTYMEKVNESMAIKNYEA